MPMMNGEQYRRSILDGRRCYMDGELIGDPSKHPLLAGAADSVAATYDRFYDPAPDAFHPMYLIPRSREDLDRRMEAMGRSDITAGTTAACMALVEVAPELGKLRPEYRDRIYAFVDDCKAADLRCSEAITDAKGHRRRRPSQQDDPDMYVRVVDRQRDGIVISGAKMHITGAPLVHEQVVLPTKSMKPGEEDYAVACSVPTNAEGLRIVNTTNAPRGDDVSNYPISSRANMPEGLLIFDNVFVPNERVFLDGETSHAAMLAHALGLWERSNAVAYSGSSADRLVGLAALLAEMDGAADRADVRDLLSELAIFATMCRAGWEAAMKNATMNEDGTLSPASLYVSAAKYYNAELHGRMIDILHDIAGALLVDAPTMADYDAEVVGADIRRHLAGEGGWSAHDRLKLLHYVRDLTADTYGGWIAVTESLAGGGQYAQRLVTLRHYDLNEAKRLARRAAGIGGEVGDPVDPAPAAVL
ncbi:MAG TPA: 4-hydroxyphenylacetate 3-hydroxylase N-terminal domain-containing protein [Acidimicrobiales bacterium]|nr:4-hydroxyphenylacetate 3-hydroxylase N-terminal domain-containing protein [Acidimicrobiales bacterium]